MSSKLESDLVVLIKLHDLPEPMREYRFAPPRKWRFDFAWRLTYDIDKDICNLTMVAAECEGGTWVNGAHSRGKHFESDCQKYNAAALQGWHIYRFTGAMIRSGEAIRTLKRALGVE